MHHDQPQHRAGPVHHGGRSAMILLPLLLATLSACSLVPRISAPVDQLFNDSAFAPAMQAIDPSQALAMSAAMKAHLREVIQPRLRWQNAHSGLIDALYTNDGLRLQYDSETTLTAAEAFAARSGNCLSLVLMTAAFARELELPVRFQSVQSGETWGRDGDLLLFIGHVNIAIGRSTRALRAWDTGPNTPADWVIVDFLPSADLQRQRSQPIDEARIVAMYLNNRAAEHLGKGRIDEAYWWARAAIHHDRDFANAYNTLGVVYLRHGQAARAEAALRFALQVERDNPHTLSNLVLALTEQGRSAESALLAQQLQRQQPSTPFGHFELGQQAMRRGDFTQAKRHFEQAVRRADDYHEFHFALAQALLKLGENAAATRQLDLARQASTTRRLQAMYADKLERLRGALLQ